MTNPADWPIVDIVRSESRPDVSHYVRRSTGGTLRCTCEAFVYSPAGNKRCSHTDRQVEIEERLAIQTE